MQLPDTQDGRVFLRNLPETIAFLWLTAHEIRTDDEKVKLLLECKRVCKPGGQVIMADHQR